MLAGGAGALIFALDRSVKASELELHPPKNAWSHSGIFSSLDHARLVFVIFTILLFVNFKNLR